jgi:hypothetical protein
MTRDIKIIVLTVFNTLLAVLLVVMLASMFYPVVIVQTDHRLSGTDEIIVSRENPTLDLDLELERTKKTNRLKIEAYEEALSKQRQASH